MVYGGTWLICVLGQLVNEASNQIKPFGKKKKYLINKTYFAIFEEIGNIEAIGNFKKRFAISTNFSP